MCGGFRDTMYTTGVLQPATRACFPFTSYRLSRVNGEVDSPPPRDISTRERVSIPSSLFVYSSFFFPSSSSLSVSRTPGERALIYLKDEVGASCCPGAQESLDESLTDIRSDFSSNFQLSVLRIYMCFFTFPTIFDSRAPYI